MRTARLIAAVTSLSLLALAPAAAQQHEHAPVKVEKDKPATPAGHSMEHMSGWKELDAYHMVMMQVWHPAKEKGDLAPIRAQASQLAASADTLAGAAIPPACDTPANREAVTKVQADSRALATLVASGTDMQVKDSLKALHDRFEVLNKGCRAQHH